MAHVQVTIAGRAYRMACDDGEEAHLEGLAATLDGKIREMRVAFGEIGDMRLQVMAALTLADDLGETRRRIGVLESELAGLRATAAGDQDRADRADRHLAEAMLRVAERVEAVARSLQPGQSSGPPLFPGGQEAPE